MTVSQKIVGVIPPPEDESERLAILGFLKAVGLGDKVTLNARYTCLTLCEGHRGLTVAIPEIEDIEADDLFTKAGDVRVVIAEYEVDREKRPENFGVKVLALIEPRELTELRAVRDGGAVVPLMDGAL